MSDITDFDREKRLEELVGRYQTPLLHMCYLYLCDQSMAEDALQEIFLKIYRNMDRFRGECSEKTWVMKIAVNTCYSMNHSGWSRFFFFFLTPEMMPDETVQTDDEDKQLVSAVAGLPLKLRKVILLYYFQNLKVNEIAETLGISQSSVSGRLKRGRDRLKTMLEGRELDE